MKSTNLFAFFSTLLFAFACVVNFPTPANSARILSLAFFSSKSHKITYEPLLQELAARGHEVTAVAPFTFGHKKYREILTFDAEKYYEEQGIPNMFETKEKTNQVNPLLILTFINEICNKTYDAPHIMDLLKETFDLIVLPVIMNECAAGFAWKFNAPIMIVSPVAVPSWLATIYGSPAPPSFVANLMTPYSQHMTFYQRTVNLLAESATKIFFGWYLNSKMDALYRERLGDDTIPSSFEIFSQRVGLVLSNSHFSLGQPRPFLPDIIEVGGMHCTDAKPLPKDLENFVNSSGKDGFILFSMGSALKGSMMPDKQRKIFLGAFGKLKQKVLWKWETETMEGLPPNVKLSKWLPQQDVLGHPKAKAFITHGGLGSTTEAVYHGVPLVGIPMFGDQNVNMVKSVESGFAVSLEYTQLSEELILDAVNKVINEPIYKQRVGELSKLFRDQPDKPLDRAVFWTEYLLRHKGAPHLRSPARDLDYFQYHSLDVIAFLMVSVLTVLYIIYRFLRFLLKKLGNLLFGGTTAVKDSKKKRN